MGVELIAGVGRFVAVVFVVILGEGVWLLVVLLAAVLLGVAVLFRNGSFNVDWDDCLDLVVLRRGIVVAVACI